VYFRVEHTVVYRVFINRVLICLVDKVLLQCTAAGEGIAAAGGYEGSPSCESTMPCGLTPKQRIAWKKEEERRRRQLELQVTAQHFQSAALWHDTVVDDLQWITAAGSC
jgi:hypothetical protein